MKINVDDLTLPDDVKAKLALLDLELSEGDITQKGFDKKRRFLLEPYISKNAKIPDSNEKCKTDNVSGIGRHMRGEPRFYSEIRQEAVHQALSEWKCKSKQNSSDKHAAPLINRRRSGKNFSITDRVNVSESESSSAEEESNVVKISTNGENLFAGKISNIPPLAVQEDTSTPSPCSTNSKNILNIPCVDTLHVTQTSKHNEFKLMDSVEDAKSDSGPSDEKACSSALSDLKPSSCAYGGIVEQQPVETSPYVNDDHESLHKNCDADFATEEVTAHQFTYMNEGSSGEIQEESVCRDVGSNQNSESVDINYANEYEAPKQRISGRIQEVLRTLQQPQRPQQLDEFFNDDDCDLETTPWMVNPNAPTPTGHLIVPACGEFPSGSEASLRDTSRFVDSVLQHWSSEQSKVPVAIQLDGKSSESLTYAKLLSHSTRIAYLLLTKQMVVTTNGVKERVHLCLPGDRVALVYPNTEPLAFLSAFYGCLIAGLVPVPIEVPLTRRDASMQQFGFLLGGCGVRVALTSESCYRGLPKATSHQKGRSSATCRQISTSPTTDFSVQWHESLGNMTTSPSSTFTSHTVTTSGSNGSRGSLESSGSNKPQKSSINHFHHYIPSGNPTDIANFKFWPRLHWVITNNASKPSKDWSLPSLIVDDSYAYIEYVTQQDGVKGVAVSRKSMLAHALAISSSIGYKKGDKIICLLDFKRESGLWHSILAAVYSGATVYFVPYSLMKRSPTFWLQQVTKHKINIAIVRSRDLHWSLLADQENTQLDLQFLRAIVVSDGENPWCLSSCDQFVATFSSKGLNQNVICPCSGSTETGTIALRRPPVFNGNHENSQFRCSSTGRGILSLPALSHCVVRVDTENSLTSLTLQDTGQVIAGSLAVVVKINSLPRLCKADEVGEICLYAPSTSSCYYGLKGLTQSVFSVSPLGPDDKQLGPLSYTRSGLIGFLGPEGLVFVVGTKHSMLHVSGRYHSADDLIATILAVEPLKFIYRGRISVFSFVLLRDERIVVVAEQKQGVNEEDCFNWMMRVVQAIDSIHHVSIYCIAFVPPNGLPKTALGGIHVFETKQRFMDRCLKPTTLLMFPQNSVLNLPKPREQQADVGPAAIFVGNIVQGARIKTARGRELTVASDECINLIDILRQRAFQTPDQILYVMINSKGEFAEQITAAQLLKRAERIGALLLEKGHLSPGNHVAIILPPGIELICAVFGCIAAFVVPVCIPPPSQHNLQPSMETVRMIVDVSRSVALLSNSSIIKILKSKEASHRVNTKAWPTILDVEDAPSSSVARRRKDENGKLAQHVRQPSDICYLDFSVGANGQLTGITVTAQGAATQCKSLKVACELYPSRSITLCLDPYSGLGFSLWCLAGVYAGHQSLLISPSDIRHNPLIWLNVLTQEKVRDTFCSVNVVVTCLRELSPNFEQLRSRNAFELSNLRSCIIISEERPRVQLRNSFVNILSPFGLNPRAVSSSFGCRTNAAICLQSVSSPDLETVYASARALRNDRITLVEKGSPGGIPLIECGKLLPGIKVAIADPKTKGQCADSHLGEIWISSGHNSSGYFTIFGEETRLQTDHFSARLTTGDVKTVFARTSFLGFLRHNDLGAGNDSSDSLFVVGSLDERILIRGMHYYPCDIEATVNRSHRIISESAVFMWSHLLVVVAETASPESEALDLVPAITNAILEEQQIITQVVVIVDPGLIPVNNRGEKQRILLRDLFLKDQLDPIYVAYNM